MFSEHNNKQKGTFLSLFNYYPSTCAIGGAMNTEPGGVGETATGDKTGEKRAPTRGPTARGKDDFG